MYLLACAAATTTATTAVAPVVEGKGAGTGQRQVFIPVAALNACVSWMAAPRFHFRAKHRQHKQTHTHTKTHNTHDTHTHTLADRHHLPFLLPDKIMTYETLADIRLKRQLKRQLALPCLAVACKVFLPRLPFVLAFRSGHKHAHTQAHTYSEQVRARTWWRSW